MLTTCYRGNIDAEVEGLGRGDGFSFDERENHASEGIVNKDRGLESHKWDIHQRCLCSLKLLL